ncbi:amino acid ABC transporter substrate-binding protein [Vagococcus hydrophili]|nr:amino acid ABC transporter substrate-binding protein [Vagococcus hydrophili]
MRRMIKLAGISLITLSVLVGCGQSSKEKNSQWDKIQKNKELVIGIDDTFVPMGFRDEKEQLVGFDIDLAKEVTKEMGLKAKFQPIDWTLKETELENGTIDVIWNGYTVTDARKNKVDFTKDYLVNEQVLVTRKESKISKFSDMKDKTLGAQEGSSGYEAFENKPDILKDIVKDQDAIVFPTFTEAFMDLEAKRIDGLLIDKVFAEYYLSKQNNSQEFQLVKGKYDNENFAIGVKKGEVTLRDELNKGLDKAYADGLSQKVSQKWFGENRVIK